MKCLIKSVASQQLLRGLSLILVLMGLSACSGDGGGSSSSSAPAPTVALTSTNAEQVTGAAFEQFLGDSTVNAAPTPLAAATTTRTRTTPTLVELAKKAASLLSQTSSTFSTAAATTDFCTNGGSTTTNYAADGTSATITYSACEEDPGVIINGSMSVSNISASGSVISFTTSFNLTFSVSGQPDVILSGGYSATLDFSTTLATTITGSYFSGTDGTDTFELFNFTFVATTDSASADYTLSGTSINGAVTVKTLTTFTYTGTYPYVGKMEITGANNSRILVTVLGDETAVDQVQIDVDADGDGVFEMTIPTTWAALGI